MEYGDSGVLTNCKTMKMSSALERSINEPVVNEVDTR